MRIAHVCMDPGIHPSKSKGAAVHLEAIRSSMRQLGAEVFEIDCAKEVQVRRELARLQAEKPLDVLYERYALGATAVSEFSREHGVPHILEVNSPLEEEALKFRGVIHAPKKSASQRVIFEQAHLVVAVSSEVAKYAIRLGADPTRVVTEPNGVDLRLFHPMRSQELENTDWLPSGKLILGVHGRLRPWHNLEMLGEVAARLLNEGAPIHLLVVGNGDYAEILERFLPQTAFTHIDWVPHANVGRYVAQFDVMPLTYERENDYFSPLKLREAMAVGAIPVVPDVGDLADVVGDSGLIYSPGSSDELHSHLHKLVHSSSLRQRLSAVAVTRAADQDWLAITRRTLEGVVGLPR